MEEKLKLFTQIKAELKCAKNKKNNFGNYKYRSLEDIFEAVKPLLVKFNLDLNVSDEMYECANGVIFIKATAILMDAEGNEQTSVGYAGIDLDKKGMDLAQATGSASSYARKYALNALFLLDDTKDNDTEEHQIEAGKVRPVTKLSDIARENIKVYIARNAQWCAENKGIISGEETEEELLEMFNTLWKAGRIDINGNKRG